MILLPKYHGIEVQPFISIKDKVGGEYRAVLRGSDGRIKYDSGWHRNQVLDTGIYELFTYSQVLNFLWYGDSDVAAAPTQTGLQGNLIPQDGVNDHLWYEYTSVSHWNAGAPTYAITVTHEYISLEGKHVGTIKEFVIGDNDRDPFTQAATRVVLTTPIVKGASDVLTMEYRFTIYLDLTDKVGTIDISGELYDYTFRRADITYSPHDFGYLMWMIQGSRAYLRVRIYDTGIGAITGTPSDNGTPLEYISLDWGQGLVSSTGGSLGSYYRTLGFDATVDQLNHTFDAIGIGITNAGAGGWQWSLNKVSDGTPMTKVNTHEFGMQWRLYLEEYVP